MSLQKQRFVGLVREKVRVSTLTAEEKREPVRANQSEISSFMKHAAVQAAAWPGVHPTPLMRMRWVIRRKPDASLKARLVVLGFTDPQLGAKPAGSPTMSRLGRQLFSTVAGSQGVVVIQADAQTAFCRGLLEIKNYIVSGFRHVTGVGLGTPPMRTTTKIGVRADGCPTRVVGKRRERHDMSRMV